MHLALIKNGIVENIVVVESGADWTPPDGFTAIEATADAYIGGEHDGEKFIPAPPPPIPEKTNKEKILELEAQITPRRLRDAVLTQEGQAWLLAIEAKISALRE